MKATGCPSERRVNERRQDGAGPTGAGPTGLLTTGAPAAGAQHRPESGLVLGFGQSRILASMLAW